jgi:hypothetical protein
MVPPTRIALPIAECAAMVSFLRNLPQRGHPLAAHGPLSAVRQRLRTGTYAGQKRDNCALQRVTIGSKRSDIDMLRISVPHFSLKTRLNPLKRDFTKSLVALKGSKKA